MQEPIRTCECGHADWEHIGRDKTGPCSHLLLHGGGHHFCDCPKFRKPAEVMYGEHEPV